MTMLNINLKIGVPGKIPLINFIVRVSIKGNYDSGGGKLIKRIKFWIMVFPLNLHSPCF